MTRDPLSPNSDEENYAASAIFSDLSLGPYREAIFGIILHNREIQKKKQLIISQLCVPHLGALVRT